MKMKAEIIQTAPQGEGASDVRIALTEERSGIQFLKIHMSLEEFGRMLHNPTTAQCTFEVRGLDRLGWLREHKTVVVLIGDGGVSSKDAEAQDAILAPYETQGWRGDRSDLTNSHRQVHTTDGLAARVSFTRHVPPGTG